MQLMTKTAKAAATRQQILDAGQALIVQKGFVAVGLKEILDVSGVPKGSFYHYFPSKEAFGCALLEQYVTDYSARMDTLLAPDGDGGCRLMRYWNAWIDDPLLGGWAEHCLVVKLAAEVADLSEDMRLVLNGGVTSLVARISALVAAGQRDGSLPSAAGPAADVAATLYQLWLGAALLSKLAHSKQPLLHAKTATEHFLSLSATTK